MMRYLIQSKSKEFSLYITTYGPIGLGVYFDWFDTETKKLRELSVQILKLSFVLTWGK